jgi:hypothetical protein
VSESGFTGSTLCPSLAPGHAWIEEMRPDSRQVLDSGGMRRFDIERGSEVERTFGGLGPRHRRGDGGASNITWGDRPLC